MAEDRLSIAIDPKVKQKMQGLVDMGEYASVSEFVKQAIQLLLNKESLRSTIYEEFNTPKGEMLFEKLLLKALENIEVKSKEE